MPSGGNIGPRIGVEGAREFKNTITSLNASLKTMGAEMAKVTAEFKGNENSAEALTAKQEVLAKQLDTLNKKADTQRERLAHLESQGKASSDEYVRLQGELYKTETALAKTENEIKDNAEKMDNLGKETEETADALDDGADASKRFGDVLKANLLSDAIIAGVKALAKGLKSLGESVIGAAAAADEINTLSIKTGIATDTLQEFRYMADLIDVDLETITGSMTKLTNNMDSAANGTGAAAEAFALLGIEVTDGNGELRDRNEVFQEAITALGNMTNETKRDAIAMDIFGKSAQELNPLIAAGSDRLEELAKEAHDVGYVMSGDTLNSLSAVQDSMDRMKSVTSGIKNQLAEALAPTIEELITKFQEWAKSVDWEAVGEKISGAVDIVRQFGNFVMDNGETIISLIAGIGAGFIAWNVVSMIHGLVTAIKAFQAANEGATIAQAALNVVMNANPIGVIITAVTALVTAITVLWNTNEDFRNWVSQAWEDIKGFFVGAWEAVKNAWNDATEFFANIWAGIKDTFSSVKTTLSGFFSDAWETIKSIWNNSAIGKYFQALWDVIKDVFAVVESVLSGDFSAAWDSIKDIWDTVTGYFEGVWEDIKGVFSNVFSFFTNVGQDLLEGLWAGIGDKIEWLKGKVSGVVDTIKGWFTGKEGFDEHSPSKWAEGVFENVLAGGAKGFESGLPNIISKADLVTVGVKKALSGAETMVSGMWATPVTGTTDNGGSAVMGGIGSERVIIGFDVDEDGLARYLHPYIVGEGQRIGAAMVT